MTPLALNLLGGALAADRAHISGRKPCLFNEKISSPGLSAGWAWACSSTAWVWIN